MSTYTQLIYHFVYSTKNRDNTLQADHRTDLYKYIWGLLNNKNCHLYRIGGVSDHIHILTHVHPTIAPATLIKDIKLAGSEFIKTNQLFPNFTGWQGGYGGFSCSFQDRDRLIEYIKNQEQHHTKKTFKEELIDLLNEHGIAFDEKYLL
ncbi:MAG: IS200/IS605 family transposase [Bacteroidota bacterium]